MPQAGRYHRPSVTIGCPLPWTVRYFRPHCQDMCLYSPKTPRECLTIGKMNAIYLFGSDLSKGYDIIWSERNDFMIHNILEKIFDDRQMVIVPDPIDDNKFISIILSQDLLKDDRLLPAINALYRTIYKRCLQF
jgi:hypothetical protein